MRIEKDIEYIVKEILTCASSMDTGQQKEFYTMIKKGCEEELEALSEI